MDNITDLIPNGIGDPIIVAFCAGVACAIYCVRLVQTRSLSLRPPRPKNDEEPSTKRDRKRWPGDK